MDAPKPAPQPSERPKRELVGNTADLWATQERITVLIAGMPKGAGKTTLAISATEPGQSTVVMACDLGRLSIPPNVDKSQVLVLPYQEVTRKLDGHGGSKPLKDIFNKITGDMYEVYLSVRDQKALTLAGGKEFPPPTNLVVDGLSRLNSMLVDGQCAMGSIDDPGDITKEQRFNFWGKRLRNMLTLVEQFASLPCNVFMTTWIDAAKDSSGSPTGVWLPDVGGKMDLLTAGIVGAALLAYSRQGRFYVRTTADGIYPWCGVRDTYGLKAEVDVTIERKPGEKSPWRRIFE